MYHISVKVIETESGLGIPDLMVFLYDFDFNTKNEGYGSRPVVPDEFPFPFESLCSAYTDDKGKVELSFDTVEFRRSEQGKGPDLLLFVASPEDARKPMSSDILPVIGREFQKRIIHSSLPFRFNAAHREAYVVRIPRATLSLYEIPSPGNRSSDSTSLIAAMENADEAIGGLNGFSIAKTQRKLAERRSLKALVEERFQRFSLSSIPAIRRTDPHLNYLHPGNNLDMIFSGILSRLWHWFDSAAGNSRRRLRFYLQEAELAQLGLSPTTAGAAGSPQLSAILSKLDREIGTGDLSHLHGIIDNCCGGDNTAADFLARLEGRTGAGEESLPPLPQAALPATDVNQAIARQMHLATPPEQPIRFSVNRNDNIDQTISRFKLEGGPADVTAFHDFQELHLALEHVWTELFDQHFIRTGRLAYEKAVKFKNRISGEPLPEEPVHDLEDLRSVLDEYRDVRELHEGGALVPPQVKTMLPDLTNQEWDEMDEYLKQVLIQISQAHGFSVFGISIGNEGMLAAARDLLAAFRARPRRGNSLDELVARIDDRMSEPLSFDVFAPNSVNFGMLLTYRQAWKPLDYQVGRLVNTIPLAPKEIRKYSTKRIVKSTRIQKEVRDRQQSRSNESTQTGKAESEIVNRAKQNTSFQLQATGSVNVGVFSGSLQTTLGASAEKESGNTKRNFREAVMKAAEEYKQQHRLEVETSVSEEMETTSSGEIMNPNDEISVTYLFYELQRSYEVSEKIQKLVPVIMVANDVPAPHEIDTDWLMTYSWILKRVILDPSFLPALDYVSTSLAGDKLALDELKKNLGRQAGLVDELTRQVQTKTQISERTFNRLESVVGLIENSGNIEAQKTAMVGLALAGPVGFITGLFGGGGGESDVTKKQEEIIKMAIERADNDTREVSAKLTREMTALQQATDKYVEALRIYMDREIEIARLRIHLKENILHYMQAIWDHEQPDQRFFRLYNVDVTWIEPPGDRAVPLRRSARRSFPHIESPVFEVELSLPMGSAAGTVTRKLAEVADLDKLLGYKGNYMIFPVKETSYLHKFMMQDYMDARTGGLADPADRFGYTREELEKYIACLFASRPEEYERRKPELQRFLAERICAADKEKEVIVVPTDSLYLECLPGKHPVMEDFKLIHRALDVKKVQAEVRMAELENIRLADRLLHEEREDPSIEKKIVIEGGDSVILPPEA